MRAAARGAHSFVAERDGAVAGFVQLFDYGTAGYVATMAVDPAVHRGGLGTALMQALIAQADAHGPAVLVLDATDMGAPLYERFGFADVDRTVVYERVRAVDATHRPARNMGPSLVGRPSHVASGPMLDSRVFAFDRDVCGCDRSAILDALAGDDAVTCRVGGDGYVMTRGEQVGPWLAATPEGARVLLAAAMNEAPHVRRVCVPESNVAAPPLLFAAGFEPQRSLRHMARGTSPFRRELIYGQASLGHG